MNPDQGHQSYVLYFKLILGGFLEYAAVSLCELDSPYSFTLQKTSTLWFIIKTDVSL